MTDEITVGGIRWRLTAVGVLHVVGHGLPLVFIARGEMALTLWAALNAQAENAALRGALKETAEMYEEVRATLLNRARSKKDWNEISTGYPYALVAQANALAGEDRGQG